MIFEETKLRGAFVIVPERIEDERGFFARTFCRREFEAHGLNPDLVQCNISFNKAKGTLRGMHYQIAPHAEAKLVRCTAGAIYDVVIDLRPESKTFRQWFGAELTAENRNMLYVPEGFAHGFQTLADESEVSYHHSAFFSPDHQGGVKYNDPALAIEWPLEISFISTRDQNLPCLDDLFHGGRV